MENQIQKDYLNDLQRIKETINENRSKAMVVVNSAMIRVYYEIGTIINERKSWGNKYIQRLAIDLKEYGKGYSSHQLFRMSQFAHVFKREEIIAQPVLQIPWSTIVQIMQKASSKKEMLWYINQTYRNRWSRSMVMKQFELQAYQRNLVAPITSVDGVIQDIVKDTLILDFISKDDIQTEKDLKDKLIDNIVLFLQELGPGFALVGREYKLITPTNKHFYIDLLMYHTKIHSYVVIEVKIGEIMPADFGQLSFYINAVNDLEKIEGDNETIGLLLCKEADKYVVKTTLKSTTNLVGVSKYKLLEELPNYLIKKLTQVDK